MAPPLSTFTSMRLVPCAAIGAAAVAATGCGIGEGTGEANGLLFVLGCLEAPVGGRDFGSAEMPVNFDLNPRFFAGEPIEDVRRVAPKMNRLIIRMQHTGQRRELNDVLAFDLLNLFEVARCVRGRMLVDAAGQMRPDYDQAFCRWTAESSLPGRGPRLRVGSDSLVRAYLTPRGTCTKNTVAVAVSTPGGKHGEWESWIELLHFGDASEREVPPAARAAVDPGFKVDLGQQIQAPFFHLTLEDDRIVKARASGEPLPPAEIGGVLDGFLDFELQRGQGGQTFP